MSRSSLESPEGALGTGENPEVLEIHRLGEEDGLGEEGFG
jgi:hypothetical protein